MAAGCAAWIVLLFGCGAADFTLLGGRAACAAECSEPAAARRVALTPAAIDRAA